MLTEYIEEALKRAHYEIINDPDEPYYSEVPELPGVWANANTLETCRENLKEVVDLHERHARYRRVASIY